jgi:hypothetical protein
MPRLERRGLRHCLRRTLVALEAARHDAFDPLYLSRQTPEKVCRCVWGARHFVAPPGGGVDGRATIRSPYPRRAGGLARGDFNDWKPAPMQRSGDHWTYVVAIGPGVYNYAFVTTGGEWFVPESVAGRKSDGMGGHVAVLVVR